MIKHLMAELVTLSGQIAGTPSPGNDGTTLSL